MKKVVSIIIVILLLPILFVSGVILINSIISPDEIPSFFGWKPFIVLSGSMETEIFPGDIVVVKEIDAKDLKENDVIAFKSGDIVVTHRVIEIKEDEGLVKYITKGDNNNTRDMGYVLPDNVEGLYKFKISKLGNLAMFIQTPAGMICTLSIPILLLLLLRIREKNLEQKELEEEIANLKKQNKELKQKEKEKENQ